MKRRWAMIGPLALLTIGTAMAQPSAAVAPAHPMITPNVKGSLMAPRGFCDDSHRKLLAEQQVEGCSALIRNAARLTTETLAGAYFNRGLAYASARDYAHAIADYGEAIRLSPRFPHAYKNRGIAYQEQRDNVRALADYNEAIRQNGTLDSVYNNRGLIHASQGDYARAIADYSEAIKLTPLNIQYYRNRGNAYLAQNDEARATADFDEIARLAAR